MSKYKYLTTIYSVRGRKQWQVGGVSTSIDPTTYIDRDSTHREENDMSYQGYDELHYEDDTGDVELEDMDDEVQRKYAHRLAFIDQSQARECESYGIRASANQWEHDERVRSILYR